MITKCSKCEKSVSNNVKFCPDCGSKIISKNNELEKKKPPKWFYYLFLSFGIIFLALEIIDIASVTCDQYGCHSMFNGYLHLGFGLPLAIFGLLSVIFLLAKKYVSTSLLLPILSMVPLTQYLKEFGVGSTIIIGIYSILTICVSLFFIWKE